MHLELDLHAVGGRGNAALRERLADLLTDSLRRDILQGCGYSASLIEFVAPEHTMKNIMIRAERTHRRTDTEKLRRVRAEINRWQTGPKFAELLDIDSTNPTEDNAPQRHGAHREL